MSNQTRFHWLKHHHCHASSAYFVSPFANAAILTVDGIGEFATTQAALGTDHRLETLWEINYPHSLGFFWEKLCRFLGFEEYDACKVMGLAAYGNPRRQAAAVERLVQVTPTGFTVNAGLLRFRQVADFTGLESVLGARRQPHAPIEPRHQDIAASLQQVTEQAILALAKRLKSCVGSDNLCLAGGVALNCRANSNTALSLYFVGPAPDAAAPAHRTADHSAD